MVHIRQLNEDDWSIYRAIRLEALALHEEVYGGSLAQESAWDETAWKTMLGDARHRFFGLFDNNDMIGNAVVFTDREDTGGRTALLAGGYIRQSYRGRGYSRLLYQARIQWAIDSGRFDRIVVGHREGNEASRRANQAFGFEPTGQSMQVWGDGSKAVKYSYEMRIAS